MQHELKWIYTLGNILRFLLPFVTLLIVIKHKNYNDKKEFIMSIIMVAAITEIIKILTQDMLIGIRPNGMLKSFPSGHTSLTFQSALFLQKKYGWSFGMPAILLSGFVSYTRILGLYHHPRDIVAGFAIAFIINAIIVKKQTKIITIISKN